jgi:hypothetical protein
MKVVLIGLLQGVGGWLVVAAGMSWLIQSLTGAAAISTLGMSLLGGAAAWAAFALLVSSWRRWRERASIRAGAQGQAPVDGRNAVLVGVIQATGPLLKAPLDGATCVTYAYAIKVYRGTGKARRLATVARGVALTPSVIVTPAGRFRLGVVPDLDATATVASQAACIDNFVAYARATPFIEAKASAQELLDRWGDDDGAYRSDVRFEPLHGASTDGWQAQQQHVAPGAQVCVVGRYDRARGAVVPSPGGTPTRLIVGDAVAVAASLRSTALRHALFGLGLAVIPVLLVLSAWRSSIPE